MSMDEINDPDKGESPGVGTDGSLTSHHHHEHHDTEQHVGVGTDGSLHSHHDEAEEAAEKDDDPRR
jgi:hypothetical protein